MKVGDLVKVYHFSDTARQHYHFKKVNAPEQYVPDDIDGHVVGLIVEAREGFCDCRVFIPQWKQTDVYALDRLEVINESR